MRCGRASVRFCLGFVLGLALASLLAAVIMVSGSRRYLVNREVNRMVIEPDGKYQTSEPWLEKSVLDRELQDIRDPLRDLENIDGHFYHDDDTEVQRLAKEVRVLIWVMTSPKTLQSRAKEVRDTWGTRANQILFFSSKSDPDFPTIGLDVPEGRQHLLEKTNRAFRYIYDNHMDDADWFMKVDDDTYVIMENLRYFLSGENTSEPLFFGHHFHSPYRRLTRLKNLPLHYHSGGAGYVISKEALRRFGEKGWDESVCRQSLGAEDVGFGECMINLGVRISDSTDALGRSRFHCFRPLSFTSGIFPGWYRLFDANGARKGAEAMSDYAISFHYIKPDEMRLMNYFIYRLQPYGVLHGLQNLNRKHSDTLTDHMEINVGRP
ncbi:hypothetical protein V1264_005422 [Littorina saxatilis]|uniref:N-acetylgalactosaminide beta-1,3-galactosyltransferase n=2 Tax=Littorina saxatilis TaxID=31220 RepID=A0AAN9G5W2_9CAEN